MKVKVSNLDQDSLDKVKAATIKNMQAYIKDHKGCSPLDMVYKRRMTTMKFLENNVVCTNCGHIEGKSFYAIAQKAMGNQITFHCDCGNKIPL